MMVVHKTIFLLLMILPIPYLINIEQDVDLTVHIKFNMNDNRLIASPPGFIGDSISYQSKRILEDGSTLFRIGSEEFKVINSSKHVQKTKQSDLEKLDFIEINQMLKTWKLSNRFLRSEVYHKIYLYEFVSRNKVKRFEVTWVGGYEN